MFILLLICVVFMHLCLTRVEVLKSGGRHINHVRLGIDKGIMDDSDDNINSLWPSREQAKSVHNR